MPRTKQRRLHLELDPPVRIQVGRHQLTFIGLTLLNRVTMVEYVADPPLAPFYPFRPAFDLQVTDDTDAMPYPTDWENLGRPELGPGRTTTHLDQRPPPDATTLQFVVRPSAEAEACGAFEVSLPSEHAAPWRPGHPSEERARTSVAAQI